MMAFLYLLTLDLSSCLVAWDRSSLIRSLSSRSRLFCFWDSSQSCKQNDGGEWVCDPCVTLGVCAINFRHPNKVRTDKKVLVRRTRDKAKLGGSFGLSRYTLLICPNLRVRTDTKMLVRRTRYRTKLGGSLCRYVLTLHPNSCFSRELNSPWDAVRGDYHESLQA